MSERVCGRREGRVRNVRRVSREKVCVCGKECEYNTITMEHRSVKCCYR